MTGFYVEDGGQFCRGCGWDKSGDVHDLLGRFDNEGNNKDGQQCDRCGRTEGRGEWRWKAEPMVEVPVKLDFGGFTSNK